MTVLVFALLGGLIGLVFLDGSGVAVGAFVGALAGWVRDLAGRVRSLEGQLAASSEPPPLPAAAEPSMAGADDVAPPAAPQRPAVSAVAARARRRAALDEMPLEPSLFSVLFDRLLRWLTTGNVPVKVGVVLSVFGVGFLVKEGIDRQWLVLPLELRLLAVALFGIGLLVLGWRLRSRQPTYALSVQGGGIAVLYLTTYASYALYQLLPAPLAFTLLVVVTAAAGVLAVLQDARALAVLGIVGGFMAPVLASSGSGNHVVLFGYYAILNVAVVGIAWFKAWRVLNVLGFVFTFGIGTLWGLDAYRPELFGSTEPFLVLFTLMYVATPVLFALRQPPQLRGFVDGTLVFGTPIVAFALQSRLVADTEFGLAISAVALAALHIGVAQYLHGRRATELRVLVEAELALAVAFATVAVPLALDARWTSAAWALQGAALVWLGFRQSRKLALAAGLALQVLSGLAYVEQTAAVAEWPIVNGYYLGALLLALAGGLSGRWFDPHRERPEASTPLPSWLATLLAVLLLVWAGGWWFAAGFTEIERHVAARFEFAAMALFAAGTALLAMLAAARCDWPRLDWLAVALWPMTLVMAVVAPWSVAHPTEDFGWLAWPALLAAMLVFLRVREARFPRLAGALHVCLYWLTVALLAWETHWQVGRVAEGVWPAAAALAVGAALVLMTLRARARLAWPLAAHARTYVQAACGGVLLVLVAATLVMNVESAGSAAPLPYVPVLNPLELVSVFVLLVLVEWLGAQRELGTSFAGVVAYRAGAAALFAWFLVTMAVGRAVHHWSGVPYDVDSLMASTTFQGALSLVWGAAGLAGMLAGARLGRRIVWFAGAVLMAVVVAKLFVVDLGNTGTLARVVSFLGVGLLLLVVGYFAPVPPRAAAVGGGNEPTGASE